MHAAGVICRIVLAIALLLVAAPASAVNPQSVAKMLEPSVVRVIVTGPDGEVSGSGFVVSRDGHVATNFHIVEPHIEADWKLFVEGGGVSSEDRRTATLIKAFPGEDLAVLQVKGLTRPPVQLSETDSERPAQGATLFAIGFPSAGGRLGTDLKMSFTTGTVNRVFTGSFSEQESQIRIIQHSAPTNPGNSGGPIVNACGQVVGVNTQREMAIIIGPGGLPFVMDFIQGVFFASHVSVLVKKLKDLGIVYSGSPRICRLFLGVASTNFYRFGGIAVFLGIILVGVLFAFRPWAVMQVIVRCGCSLRDGAMAVHRAIWGATSRGELVPQDEVVAPCAPQASCAPHGSGWRLIGQADDEEAVEIVVTTEDLNRSGDGMVIGSDPSCDKLLREPSVSSRHLRLIALGGGLGVMDLHSITGSMVNGIPLRPDAAPTPLPEGSQLKLGNVTLRLERR